MHRNVALSVHPKLHHTLLKQLKVQSLTEEDVRSLFQDRRSRLMHFFTSSSKEATCISMTRVQSSFWKSIDNHNRSTKRRIGRLKELINKKSEISQLNLPILICVCMLISVIKKLVNFEQQ